MTHLRATEQDKQGWFSVLGCVGTCSFPHRRRQRSLKESRVSLTCISFRAAAFFFTSLSQSPVLTTCTSCWMEKNLCRIDLSAKCQQLIYSTKMWHLGSNLLKITQPRLIRMNKHKHIMPRTFKCHITGNVHLFYYNRHPLPFYRYSPLMPVAHCHQDIWSILQANPMLLEMAYWCPHIAWNRDGAAGDLMIDWLAGWSWILPEC